MARESARSKDTAKPGIKEVAAVAGVSPTTVSRVLNNRGYISQETRDKVHAAMERINYTPNDIARAMLNGRLNLIGMIVPFVSSPFHAQVVQAVERTLAENGFKMLLCNSANRPDLERSYIDMLRRNMVDGVIVNSLNIGAEAYAEMGLSLVGIDCDLGEGSVQIASDSYGIGELATRRLIDDGYPNSLRLVIHLVHPRLPFHDILTRYNGKICQSFSYVKRFHTNTSFRSSSRRQTVDICR